MIFLLALALLQQPKCAYPASYDGCLYTGTDVQLPGTPPFSATTPANTCVQLPDLSKGKMCRVTDPSFGTCPQWSATHSGGDYDVISNVTGTAFYVTCGGASYVLGYNPTTLQVTNLGQSLKTMNVCIGPPAWSRVQDNVLLCKPDAKQVTPLGTTTGTQLYSLTFLYQAVPTCGLSRCIDVTQPAAWKLIFDFANCPQASTANVTSGSIAGLGPWDGVISFNLSWAGGQNTATNEFAYFPATNTCSTFNSHTSTVYLTNGAAVPALNALTGLPLQATFVIHDSDNVGSWVAIGKQSCVGVDCGSTDAGEVWQPGTPNIVMLSAQVSSSGHGTHTMNYFINNGNPTLYKRLISNPATYSVIFQGPNGKQCCQDNHYNTDMNDTDPIIAVSGGPFPSTSTPAAYFSEIYLPTMDGSLKTWRCCHTYSSGSPLAGFEGEYAIGAPNQPHTVFCFSSDMNGALGQVMIGNTQANRADIFCAGLVGQ